MAQAELGEVERMRSLLGISASPMVDTGVRDVINYFRDHPLVDSFDRWDYIRAPALKSGDLVRQPKPIERKLFFKWVDYIRGIDFHCRVTVGYLKPGQRVSRHRPLESRAKPFVYLTVPGTSQHQTGTSFSNSELDRHKVAGVVFEKFEVSQQIRVLISRCSGVKFSRTDQIVRAGGGMQYIIAARDMNRLKKV